MKHYVNQHFTRVLLLVCIFTLGGLSQSCSRLMDKAESVIESLKNDHGEEYPLEEGLSFDSPSITQGQYLGYQLKSLYPTLFSEGVKSVVQTSLTGAGISSNLHSSFLPYTPAYTVYQYTITYKTKSAKGDMIFASAAVFSPQNNDNEMPMILYFHGTQWEDSKSVTHGRFDLKNKATTHENEISMMILLASEGYIVVVPDQLGFGASSGNHPYLHSSSLSQDGIDAALAAKALFTKQKFGSRFNGKLFITGYSSGGLIAMTAHQKVETSYASEFTFLGSAPSAGPYDLVDSQMELMLGNTKYSAPGYAPYLVESYEEIYGDVYTDSSDVYKTDYVPHISKFDGQHSDTDINTVFPSVIKEGFKDDFVSDLQEAKTDPANPNNPPFFKHLMANSPIYDTWSPAKKMTLLHLPSDEIVPYDNATNAKNKLGGDVTVVDPTYGGLGTDPTADHHELGFIPCLAIIKSLIDQY